MRLHKLDAMYREVLALIAVYDRLGFDIDQQVKITAAPTQLFGVDYERALIAVLTHRGDTFNFVFGETDKTDDELEREMRAAMEAWNAASQRERDKLYRRSEVVTKHDVAIAAALKAKGITPPCTGWSS